jgi:Chloroplast envelope transporter
MNGNIYQTRQLSNYSFFQKLFKQYPQENAVIELNNLFSTKPILEILQDEIEEIENKYQLNLKREFHLNLEEFYAVYLNYCLKDKILNDQELTELNYLKSILNLDGKTIEKLHIILGQSIYKKSFQEAVADGRLTKNEEEFLSKLENTLRLPKELADKISAQTRTSYIENYVAQIVADQRLSPNEEEEIQAIANSLNVNVQLNEQTKEQLRKLKLYWALENLDLPAIHPDILIQKSEVCHLKISDANWYELRSVRQSVSHSGYSTSFNVAKGFYLQTGSYKPKSYSVDTLKLIDTGTLYLTNKRILFIGTNKNSNIRIDKILNLTPYIDGVEIGKETGKSPTLKISQNADIFCIMLERILKGR